MLTDTIADMLTRIRNAILVRKEEVEIPYSKMKFAIAKILEKEGYIEKVTDRGDRVKRAGRGLAPFVIRLKYEHGGIPAIESIHRVSRPSRRVYSGKDEFTNPRYRYGIRIISTSKGLLSHRDAFQQKIGGEVICEVR